MTGSEPTVAQKVEVNKEEKCRIASYAASLIEPEDFIFLDAGTTTGYMMDYLEEKNATFVTNAVVHAQKLAEMGMKVLLAEEFHRSDCRGPGDGDDPSVSFHEGIFRYQRCDEENGIYHTGSQ